MFTSGSGDRYVHKRAGRKKHSHTDSSNLSNASAQMAADLNSRLVSTDNTSSAARQDAEMTGDSMHELEPLGSHEESSGGCGGGVASGSHVNFSLESPASTTATGRVRSTDLQLHQIPIEYTQHPAPVELIKSPMPSTSSSLPTSPKQSELIESKSSPSQSEIADSLQADLPTPPSPLPLTILTTECELHQRKPSTHSESSPKPESVESDSDEESRI